MKEKLDTIYDKIKNIEYGWYDKKNVLHEHIDHSFLVSFKMQTCEEVIKNNKGICWEIVELTRYYCEKENIECKTYFIEEPSIGHYCHAFLIVEDNNKCYWIEGTLKQCKGINEFNDKNEVIQYLLDHFDYIANGNKYKKENLHVFEYKKPKEHIHCFPFFLNVYSGKKIK